MPLTIGLRIAAAKNLPWLRQPTDLSVQVDLNYVALPLWPIGWPPIGDLHLVSARLSIDFSLDPQTGKAENCLEALNSKAM
ncbi:hypothetical protein [Nitrosococcus wardiae]|uniref:Uncharacterized protein n=1 Tax=Nitrosococcus wardiae TaxID=1814290 RepID=A0A4P7C2J2_9GAMM|nr:hypothetical protein [Nitrosococcus wardiae]QBQ55066.1 hypothetical protein E3U44_11505 [Nitrosococcus wardiae]